MEFNKEIILDDKDNHSNETGKPSASRVYNDDDNIKERDLERHIYNETENSRKPIREGQPMGGQNFGQNNLTSSANDKNNPSQYAGTTNAYFNRTEPSEEHPEDTNFKVADQDGSPDYDKAQSNQITNSDMPKPEKVERGNGENDRPHKGDTYQEGTADNEQTNIPGPGELPDQQKVGETDDETNGHDHIET